MIFEVMDEHGLPTKAGKRQMAVEMHMSAIVMEICSSREGGTILLVTILGTNSNASLTRNHEEPALSPLYVP
jgi:hypothetical protein